MCFQAFCAGVQYWFEDLNSFALVLPKLNMFGIDDDSAWAFFDNSTRICVYECFFMFPCSRKKFSHFPGWFHLSHSQSVTRMFKMRFSQTVFVRCLLGGSSPNLTRNLDCDREFHITTHKEIRWFSFMKKDWTLQPRTPFLRHRAVAIDVISMTSNHPSYPHHPWYYRSLRCDDSSSLWCDVAIVAAAVRWPDSVRFSKGGIHDLGRAQSPGPEWVVCSETPWEKTKPRREFRTFGNCRAKTPGWWGERGVARKEQPFIALHPSDGSFMYIPFRTPLYPFDLSRPSLPCQRKIF